MRLNFTRFLYIAFLLVTFSCSRQTDYSNPPLEVVREFRTNVSTLNVNYPINFPDATSQFLMQVYSDSASIKYEVYLDSLRSYGGPLTGVSINLGGPFTDSGRVLIQLTGRLNAFSSTGDIKGLRRGLIDTLLNDNIDKYVNITTAAVPQGMFRGQLNSNITFSANVNLTPLPSVTTNTFGKAMIRVTTYTPTITSTTPPMPVRTLYTKFVIENEELTDSLNNATISEGTILNVGNVLFTLGADFRDVKRIVLTEEEYNKFLEQPLVINLTSANNKNGKIRGQLR